MVRQAGMNMWMRVLVVGVALLGADTLIVGWSVGTACSALLTAFALVVVRHGIRSGSRLESAMTVAWLYWGLSYVSNLVEALSFGVITRRDAGMGAVAGLAMAVGAATLLEVLSGLEGGVREARTAPAPGLMWRVPLLAFLFFVTYLAAGIAIYPWVRSFYAGRALPTITHLLVLQLCRGAFDLACVYPVFRQWRWSRGRAVGMSAVVFTVLCGWGPLLLPNQFMPAGIRLAHGVEMGASGVVFGAVAAVMLLRRREAGEVAGRPAGLADGLVT